MTQLLSYLSILDELRAICHAERLWPIFGAKIEVCKHKMVYIFHFLHTGMVFKIVNPFSWIFNVISREKSCLISMPLLTCLLDVRTLEFFPPAESWLVNSNFSRPSRVQSPTITRCYFDFLLPDYFALNSRYVMKQTGPMENRLFCFLLKSQCFLRWIFSKTKTYCIPRDQKFNVYCITVAAWL